MIQTHIHPYAVRKEHVRIPLETGNPELDFLNELYTTALQFVTMLPFKSKTVSLSFLAEITITYEFNLKGLT